MNYGPAGCDGQFTAHSAARSRPVGLRSRVSGCGLAGYDGAMSRTRRAVLAAWSVAALVACRPRVDDKPPNPAVWGDPNTGAGVTIPIERSPAPVGAPSPVLDLLASEVARNLDQLKS